MVPLHNLYFFLLTILLVLVMPGPTNTLLATAGLEHGFRRSARLTIAECGGYVIAISLWGVFLLELARTLFWLSWGVRLASATYMGYLAVRMMERDVRLGRWASKSRRHAGNFCSNAIEFQSDCGARTPSPSSTVSLSPSANIASMINRMACSHRCETDQPTPDETDAATGSTSGPPWDPPQLLHALETVTNLF
jgi:hypothetical protein